MSAHAAGQQKSSKQIAKEDAARIAKENAVMLQGIKLIQQRLEENCLGEAKLTIYVDGVSIISLEEPVRLQNDRLAEIFETIG